jgi:hypothetical protein
MRRLLLITLLLALNVGLLGCGAVAQRDQYEIPTIFRIFDRYGKEIRQPRAISNESAWINPVAEMLAPKECIQETYQGDWIDIPCPTVGGDGPIFRTYWDGTVDVGDPISAHGYPPQ